MSNKELIGIDAGSTAAKLVSFDNKKIKYYKIVESHRWRELLQNVSGEIYSTGYFRKKINSRIAITEVTAASLGAKYYFPKVEVIVDLGGQDVKVIDTRTNRFQLNDKCSAGTGAFLEFIASYFGLSVKELGSLHLKAKKRVPLNNTCTVFALSEIISLLVKGYTKEEVVASMHYGFATRIAELIPEADRIALIGGVAKNQGVVSSLEDILAKKLLVPPEPQIINALGAVLYALKIQ